MWTGDKRCLALPHISYLRNRTCLYRLNHVRRLHETALPRYKQPHIELGGVADRA